MKVHFLTASLAALAVAACTPPAIDGGANTQNAAQMASAAAPVSCESPAQPTALGATVNANIPAATSYPENARYFCFAAPAGLQSITITVSGMSADLDLFVGSNGIQSVQGVDIQQGQTYEWMSRAEGTATDSVTIDNPRAATYYVEIVSYMGEASPFTLAIR